MPKNAPTDRAPPGGLLPPGRVRGLALLLLLLATGCRSVSPGASLATGDRLFAAGDHGGAARAYEAHLARRPDGEGADAALFRLGVIRLLPGTPHQDWRAARAHFERLIKTFPASPYRPQAEVVLHLQKEIERLFRQLEELKRLDLERSRRRPQGSPGPRR